MGWGRCGYGFGGKMAYAGLGGVLRGVGGFGGKKDPPDYACGQRRGGFGGVSIWCWVVGVKRESGLTFAAPDAIVAGAIDRKWSLLAED